MDEVDQDETFVVTRNGAPVGTLAPPHRHNFLPAERAAALFQAEPRLDYGRFRADLDATADQDATSPRA